VKEILSDRVSSKAFVNNDEEVGVAEAPRGTLIHLTRSTRRA
jgi:coenzyme F420-reducing hydrogenase alpha subunit